MTNRKKKKMVDKFSNSAETILKSPIRSYDDPAELMVVSVAKFPATGTFTILVDNEYMNVTAVDPVDHILTAERAKEGSAATGHDARAIVRHVLAAGDINDLGDRVTVLETHIVDTIDAHDASAISYVPTGNIAATDVQAAISELGTEDAADHIADTADAHDASAISYDPTVSGLASTDVQGAIDEVESNVLTPVAPVASLRSESFNSDGLVDSWLNERPTARYGDGITNGAPIIEALGGGLTFNGTNEYGELTSTGTPLDDDDYTIFFVIRDDGVPNDTQIFGAQDSTVGLQVYHSSGLGLELRRDDDTVLSGEINRIDDTGFNVVSLRYNKLNDTVILTAGVINNFTAPADVSTATMPGSLDWGGGNTDYAATTIRVLDVFDQALTDGQHDQWFNDLRNKYALAPEAAAASPIPGDFIETFHGSDVFINPLPYSPPYYTSGAVVSGGGNFQITNVQTTDYARGIRFHGAGAEVFGAGTFRIVGTNAADEHIYEEFAIAALEVPFYVYTVQAFKVVYGVYVVPGAGNDFILQYSPDARWGLSVPQYLVPGTVALDSAEGANTITAPPNYAAITGFPAGGSTYNFNLDIFSPGNAATTFGIVSNTIGQQYGSSPNERYFSIAVKWSAKRYTYLELP